MEQNINQNDKYYVGSTRGTFFMLAENPTQQEIKEKQMIEINLEQYKELYKIRAMVFINELNFYNKPFICRLFICIWFKINQTKLVDKYANIVAQIIKAKKENE